MTLLAYSAAVVALTWPLVTHLTTHRPGPFPAMTLDSLMSSWSAGWTAHALATAPFQLVNANIFHPSRHAFFYGPNGLGLVPYFAPAFLLSGNPALAANIAFLSCVALTAFGLHRVIVGWTGSDLAGAVAGATFLTTPWVLWAWLPAELTYVTLLYLPWIIALAALPSPSTKQLVCLGVLVALQCLTDPLNVALAVILPLASIVVARIVRRETRSLGLRQVRVLLAAVLVQVPIYVGYATVLRTETGLSEQNGWDGVIPPWLAAFDPVVIAGRLQLPLTLPWGLQENFGPIGVPQIALAVALFGGIAFLLRADLTTRRAIAWRHAVLWTVVGAVVSIPVVKVWDSGPLRSPLFLLAETMAPQLLRIVHTPERLGVAALMGLALAAGLGFAECGRLTGRFGRAPATALAITIVAVMYAEWRFHTRVPYPIFEPPSVPAAILAQLRSSGGPLLELPASRAGHSRAMYRSLYHWRPLLNGYSSYFPTGFPARMKLAQRLPDPAALTLLRLETGLEVILVHLPSAENRAAWNDLASGKTKQAGLEPIAADGDSVLFAVHDPAPGEVPGPGRTTP